MTRILATRVARGILALLVVQGLCAPCSVATAAVEGDVGGETGSDFVWEAPTECPTRVQAAVRLAPIVANVPLASRPRIEARVTRSGALYVLSLRLSTTEGVRRLEAKRCDALLEGAALMLSVAVSDEEESTESSEGRVPSVHGDSAVAPSDSGISEHPADVVVSDAAAWDKTDASVTSKATSAAWWLTASALADFGSLHAWTGGVHVQLARSMAALRLGVGITWLPRNGVRFAEAPTIGGDFSLLAMDVDGCWTTRGAVQARGCLVLESGVLSASGHGVSYVRTVAAWWLAPGVEVGGHFPLGRELFVDVAVAALTALLRPEFEVNGVEDGLVFRPEPYLARAKLGLSMVF